jgi:hypothetical protein
MATYAVLSENSVINIIVADSKEIAESVTRSECIEYTDENPAHIGDTWDGTNFVLPVTEELVDEEL